MLFNDRFGLQRIYYHEGKDAFYFAAEAKAILKVQPGRAMPILAGLESSSLADACSRIELCFGTSMSCHPAQPGFSVAQR